MFTTSEVKPKAAKTSMRHKLWKSYSWDVKSIQWLYNREMWITVYRYILIMDGKTTFKIGYFKSMATTINGYGNQLFSMYLLTLCFKSELLIIHIAHFNLLGFQQDSYNKQLQYFRLKFSTCNQLFIIPLFHWSNTF